MLRRFFFCFAIGFLGVLLASVLIGWSDFLRGRNFSREDLEFSMILLDRNGEEIFRSFDRENREWVSIDKIPKILQTATISREDRRFWHHPGVDFFAILRAGWRNWRAGEIREGGSTITQQLARKIFLSDQQTFRRKFREAAIAFGIESKFSKTEILEMYLNTVPYGARENGVRVASNFYFKKTPQQLSDAETLVLAMLPQNPVGFDSKVQNWLDSPSPLKKLVNEVAKQNKWDRRKIKKILDELKKITLPRRKKWVREDFLHFSFFVRDFLASHGVLAENFRDGLVVKTSLDSKLQSEIYKILRTESTDLKDKFGIGNLATIFLENSTRAPIVWIGSLDFWENSISGQVDVLRSKRQWGSAIKPFVYAAAIEAGFEPPTVFDDSSRGRVQNSDGKFLGGLQMREALAKSRNIPAIEAFTMAGGERKVRNFLDEKFGFEINQKFPQNFFGWTLALGTAPLEISMLANGYASLATGEQREICPILEMRDFAGNLQKSPCDSRARIGIRKTTSFFLGEILADESARPETHSWRENLTIPNFNVSAKTGTSTTRVNGKLRAVDNLIVGFTPRASFVLWGGNSNGAPLRDGAVSVWTIGKIWNRAGEVFFTKFPELHGKFAPPADVRKINGEWATKKFGKFSDDGIGFPAQFGL